ERGPHDADDRERPVVHLDGTAYYPRISAEVALPDRFAQDRYIVISGLFLFGRKRAPHQRLLSHEVEEVGRHAVSVQAFRTRLRRMTKDRALVSSHLREQAALRSPVQKVRRRNIVLRQ